MSFRDDEEALRNRIANLQGDLRERDADHAEIEALRRRIADLEAAGREAAASVPTRAELAGLPPAVAPERPPPIVRPPVEPELRSRPLFVHIVSGTLLLGGFALPGFAFAAWVPALAPDLGRVAAPFLCPSGYGWSSVVASTSHQMTWQLQCHTVNGVVDVDTVYSHPLLGFFGSVLFYGGLWLWLKRVGRRRQREADDLLRR